MIKNLVYLSILTAFVVAVWIGFSIYHAVTTSTISSAVGVQIQQIPATFDGVTISNLKKLQTIPVDLKQKVMIPQVSETPFPKSAQTSGSPSAQLTTQTISSTSGAVAQSSLVSPVAQP